MEATQMALFGDDRNDPTVNVRKIVIGLMVSDWALLGDRGTWEGVAAHRERTIAAYIDLVRVAVLQAFPNAEVNVIGGVHFNDDTVRINDGEILPVNDCDLENEVVRKIRNAFWNACLDGEHWRS